MNSEGGKRPMRNAIRNFKTNDSSMTGAPNWLGRPAGEVFSALESNKITYESIPAEDQISPNDMDSKYDLP
jgi:hypothetical protein